MVRMNIDAPYLVFVGDEEEPTFAKTALGLVDWNKDKCLGQLRFSDASVDLGLPNMTPAEAAAAGAKTLVVGVAPIGGSFHPTWLEAFEEALVTGLDIAAGLHTRLNDEPRLTELAAKYGRTLHDFRVPPATLPVGTGAKRNGLRLLTVGTDCAIGKKYTALALWREMRTQNMNADFRASGQTGILISGGGIPIDSVVCDFTSGAAELLSPDNDSNHWDLIEGQGSLFHPGYAGVSLGLLHGSQPDAFVVCHEAGRTEINGYPGYLIPSLQDCIDHTIACGLLTNGAIRCVGVSINTSSLSDDERQAYLKKTEAEVGLPCVDPMKTGVGPIVDNIQNVFGS